MNRPEPPSRARLEERLEITVSKTRYGRGYEGREHDLRYIDSYEGQYALRQRFPSWQLHLERQPRCPESVDHSEPEEASSDRGRQHPPPRCACQDGGEGKPSSRSRQGVREQVPPCQPEHVAQASGEPREDRGANRPEDQVRELSRSAATGPEQEPREHDYKHLQGQRYGGEGQRYRHLRSRRREPRHQDDTHRHGRSGEWAL